MYVPHFNAVEDEQEIRRMVAEIGSAQLVTVGADGYPLATLLPVVWRGDTVIAHIARANQHWKAIGADSLVLLVVTGPQAYISPTWYASKAEHGKVVPTWNYSVVQLTGRATVHDDRLGARRGGRAGRPARGTSGEPWRSTDAPEKYIRGQLRSR